MQLAKITKFFVFLRIMESKRFSAWMDLGLFAAILLGAVLVAGVFGAILMPVLDKGRMLFATYTISFGVASVAAFFAMRTRGGGRLHFGAGWADAPLVVMGVIVITAAGVVIEPLIEMFPADYFERLNAVIGRGGWAIVTTVVAAPVLEEIFFRGLVLETLSRRWSGGAAVAASATLFGLAHAPIWPQMINAFVLAVVMGYIYLQTRSLIPVIVIHAINNGIAYIQMEMFGTEMITTRELIGRDAVYWGVYAASCVILVSALAVMHRATHRT